METKYNNDKETGDSENCEKEFDSSTTITGGLITLSCPHKICKGYKAFPKGESANQYTGALFRRLPPKVQAKKRIIIFDYACQMHKVCLLKFPYRV